MTVQLKAPQDFSAVNNITNRNKVAFVQSCWHRDIVDQLRDSFLTRFSELSERKVDLFELPGALEIPLYAKHLIQTGEYAGIIAAGLVVDGGIYRHEFVETAVIDGMMQVQLESGTPSFSAVLTPHDFLSDGQPEFFKQHFIEKGTEAANACAQTLDAMEKLS